MFWALMTFRNAYVDDTNLSDSVRKNKSCLFQNIFDKFVTESRADGLQLKDSKSKELRTCFFSTGKEFQPKMVNEENVEVVTS